MTDPTEPTWTRDAGHFKTTHAGYACWVRPPSKASHSCHWEVENDEHSEEGHANSVELAQACALRTAEAMAVIERCKKADPPESSTSDGDGGNVSPPDPNEGTLAGLARVWDAQRKPEPKFGDRTQTDFLRAREVEVALSRAYACIKELMMTADIGDGDEEFLRGLAAVLNGDSKAVMDVNLSVRENGEPPESSGNRKDRDSLLEAADAALDALLAGSACGPARAQRAVGLLRDAGANWSRHSDRLRALLLDPATEETLADTYALACARRAYPGLVDDAALSLWKEDVGAGAMKQAYMDGLSVSRSLAVERDRLRGALRVIRRVMGPALDEGEWSISMDPIAGIVAALAMDDLPEMPEDAWGELVREARALLSDTATDEVTEVTQPDT